tara:strand:+ start:630 stop:806 length:177 start_codon:yes stop_codon:yes gene_type:complete
MAPEDQRTTAEKIKDRCYMWADCHGFKCGLGRGLGSVCYGNKSSSDDSCYVPEDEDIR